MVILSSFLEYLDGRRLNDEASYSDLIANSLGVGLALLKNRVRILSNFDLSLSYLNILDITQRNKLLNYDRITHWLTYNLNSSIHIPLRIGLGYGVQSAFKKNVQSQLFLGLGFTLSDLVGKYVPSLQMPLGWLGIYQIGFQIKIS